MAKKLSSVLGIDIGSHSIKLCEVKSSGKNATVSAVTVVPTPEGSVDDTGVYGSDVIGAKIKEAISASGASSSSVVVSVAGQQSVLVRVFEFDATTDAEVKSQVDWELSRNMPFSESTVMSDYKAFPKADPSAPKTQVVAAMSPQSAIDTIVDCVKRSGRKPYAIDVQPLGLARTLATSVPQYAGEGVCVVDLGHMTTSINIYGGGNLVLPRPIRGCGKDLTDSIAATMGLGSEEAENYKCTRFAIPSSAQAGSGFNDPFAVSDATQGFGGGYSAGGYEPSSAESYTPGADATVGMSSMPSADQLDDLAIDPITGLPMEAPVADVTQAVSTYANDPFAVDVIPEVQAVAETFDPMATTSFDSFGAASAPAAYSATPAVVAGQDDPAFDAARYLFEELVSELQRSIDYYSGQGGTVSRVLLCGGGSRIKGLDGYLQRSLNITTEVFDPLNNLGLVSKKVGMDYINEYRHQLAVAVGNGLHIMFD
jgi:type IV pilus assembly protein PilM